MTKKIPAWTKYLSMILFGILGWIVVPEQNIIQLLLLIIGYNIPLFIDYLKMNPKRLLRFHRGGYRIKRELTKNELEYFAERMAKGSLILGPQGNADKNRIAINSSIWDTLSDDEKEIFRYLISQYSKSIGMEFKGLEFKNAAKKSARKQNTTSSSNYRNNSTSRAPVLRQQKTRARQEPSNFNAISSNKNSSSVRQWTNNRMTQFPHDEDISIESIFILMMYGLTTVFEPSHETKYTKEELEVGFDVDNHFGGDSTLFEMGCYVCFRLDHWLLKNEPSLRNQISPQLLSLFENLFAKALNINTIRDIIDDRLDAYEKTSKRNSTDEEVFNYRSLAIFQTKDNAPPQMEDTGNTQQDSFFEFFNLNSRLSRYDEHMMPLLIEGIQEYCVAQ